MGRLTPILHLERIRYAILAKVASPDSPRKSPMRNIIICCDGTGNEISENISNVLKLYRCLRKTEKTQPRQLVFYDPGVGTLERPDPWRGAKQSFGLRSRLRPLAL